MFFICFSHVERFVVAQSLAYHLKNFGYNVWYDYDELFIGDNGDYLNFDEGLYKADYIIIIVSLSLFQSPCAISELEAIYKLYTQNKITIIPLLYNIISEQIPIEFSWINDLIYAEITPSSGTLDVATQISAKYLEDIIRTNQYTIPNDFSCQNDSICNFVKKSVKCYTQIDINNINARATALYILSIFLNNFFQLSKVPLYCFKSIEYLYQNTNLNIKLNFKEISIMENCIIILLNLIDSK